MSNRRTSERHEVRADEATIESAQCPTEDELGLPPGFSLEGFQDRVSALLEWLADHDPVRAARLIGDYLEDLAGELGPTGPRAT